MGYNNAGKTNVLRAIAWVIRRASLPSEDFHDATQAVVVEAEISGITANVLDAIDNTHRTKIEPHIVDGKLCIRRTQVSPNQAVGTLRFEVQKIEGGQPVWALNPAGIDAAISALFPEPIFVGAMENATEDVAKFGSGTTIGKLLKEIMTPVVERHTPTVAEALVAVGRQLAANSEVKDESLVALDQRIQAQLEKFFPGVTAKTHVPVPEFADFMKGATIKLFEQGFDNGDGRDASSLGHGAQRSVQIALVKCLAEVKRATDGDAGRTTLLLIDEPELYLHPQAIEVVRAALSRLSTEGYQVVLTTHSPHMITRLDAPNTLLIRRSAAGGTTCLPRIGETVRQVIGEAAHQSEILFALSNSSKILFSERVAIAEGKTERHLLPAIFEHRFGLSPDEDRLALVEIGSSTSIPDTRRVLRAMGVPCKAVVDLDFVFRVAPGAQLIPVDDARLLACMAVLVRLRDSGMIDLDDSGLPRSFNGKPASHAFELLAQDDEAHPHIASLHNTLKQLGIWAWKKGAIEAYLGIAKSPAAKAAFLEHFRADDYRSGLPDYDGVLEALEWLRE